MVDLIEYDAIIIGSGQAGTPLALRLAAEGRRVAIIEKEHYGGSCVNTGCTPTKAYVASARRLWAATRGEELGIEIPPGARANLGKIKARKDALVRESAEGIRKQLMEDRNITVCFGQARFSGKKEVEVRGERMKAGAIFINVGGRPRIPEDFKKGKPLTNESLLELTDLPEHLLIAGGSYLGLEFAQMFRRFGSRVTLAEKKGRIVPKEDREVSESIQEFLEAEGIQFRLSARCLSAKRMANGQVGLQLSCRSGAARELGSHLLLAIGQESNTDTLDLKETGLKADRRGYLSVNNKLETEVKGIYALGDCNGQGGFTHTSYNDFEIVSNHLFGDNKRMLRDRIPTYALFTDPPLGRVGMTLSEARKTGRSILVGERSMKQVARAREKGETNGFIRIIVDARSKLVLGASVLGVGGDEVIAGITTLMYARAPYTVLRDSVQIHPTVSELLPTVLGSLKEI